MYLIVCCKSVNIPGCTSMEHIKAICVSEKEKLIDIAMNACMAAYFFFLSLYSKSMWSWQLHFALVLMADLLLSPLYQNMSTAR